jgi:hypothetical protein
MHLTRGMHRYARENSTFTFVGASKGVRGGANEGVSGVAKGIKGAARRRQYGGKGHQ